MYSWQVIKLFITFIFLTRYYINFNKLTIFMFSSVTMLFYFVFLNLLCANVTEYVYFARFTGQRCQNESITTTNKNIF